ELEEPVVLERAIAARLDDRGAGGLVVVVCAERVAMPALSSEPIDQPHPRRDELGVGRVADPLQQLDRAFAFVAQLVERHAAELQMRETACRAVARVQMISAL